MKFYATYVFFHFALDGQKTELILRCIDSQRGYFPRSVKKSFMLSYIKFYADGIGRDV